MKNRITIALMIAVASSLALAGPANMNVVSKDAAVVLHIDMQSFRSSTLGNMLLAELQDNKPEQLKEFESIFGDQILQQISGITFYTSGPEEENAVGIITGGFTEEKIKKFIESEEKVQATRSEYGSSSIYEITVLEPAEQQPSEDKPATAALNEENLTLGIAGKNLVIAKDLGMLKKAIDVINKPELNASGKFKAKRLNPGTLLSIEAQGFNAADSDSPAAQLGQNVKSMAGALSENEGELKLAVNVETFKAEQATQIQQSVQGLMFMAMMMQESPQPELTALVQAVKIQADGPNVTIDVKYPAQKLIALLKQGTPLKVTPPAMGPNPAASQGK